MPDNVPIQQKIGFLKGDILNFISKNNLTYS